MAMSFPASPTDGETIDGPGGVTWTWDGTKWTFTPSTGGGGASVEVGDNPPASPSPGNLWFNTEDSQLYIFDTNENQWIVVVNQAIVGPAGPQGIPGPGVMPPGITNGSNAAAGQVGEYLSQTIVQNLTGASNVTLNWTLQLTAGDWDVEGFVAVSSQGQGFSSMQAQITIPSPITTLWTGYIVTNGATTPIITVNFPKVRINTPANNTATFQINGVTVGGGTWGPFTMANMTYAGLIQARRVR